MKNSPGRATAQPSDYMDADAALAALGIKPATLYAYVSRGLVRRVRDARTRRSTYARADVERLAARRHGAVSRTGAASTSMRWGEPVISTAITRVTPEGPYYRNKSAFELAHAGATFESVAHLLLTGLWQPDLASWPAMATPDDARRALRGCQAPRSSADVSRSMAQAVLALGMDGRGAEELTGTGTAYAARLVLQTIAGCFGLLAPASGWVERGGDEPIAQHALRAAGVPRDERKTAVLDGVLIMLADHELATASFAARTAASTESDLYCCVVAAICTHSGRSTAAATDLVTTRLFEPLSSRNEASLRALVRERGTSSFGFNHPLYAGHDPRAEYILAAVASLGHGDPRIRRFLDFIARVRAEFDMHPGIAVGLSALVHVLGMPGYSGAAIWTLSRTAGWMAHVLEQRTQAYMLRPRAKYVAG